VVFLVAEFFEKNKIVFCIKFPILINTYKYVEKIENNRKSCVN
jgi:hypothetical protein